MKLSTKIKCSLVAAHIKMRENMKYKKAKRLGLIPCPVYVYTNDDDIGEDQWA